MARNTDTRVIITKKMIKEALLSLLEEKPIAKVTVKELCEKAGINRGTFYLHYNEPNDVLREIEAEWVDRSLAFFDPYMQNDEPDQMAQLFAGIMADRRLSLVLFGDHGSARFVERIKEMIRPRVIRDWQVEFPDYQEDDLAFVFEFVFPGAMRLILNWLGDDGGISASQFAHRLDVLGHYSHLAIREFG